jgi:hypothetical protein
MLLPMRLILYDGPTIADPSPDDVERLLRALGPDGVAVLESAELTFVQTVRYADSYLLEHQEGDVEDHYEHPDGATLDEVVDVFLSYLRGDEAWRTRVPWRHRPPDPPGGSLEPSRPWPFWARAARAMALVAGAFIAAACCGRDEAGWILGPVAALLVAALLFLVWRSDRRD